MRTRTSFYSLMGLTGSILLLFPIAASSTSSDINASANFRAAISLGNEQNMDFGVVEYTGGALVTADRVRLGTDGSIIYTGSNFSGSGSGQAGYVEILSGTPGYTVEIDCQRNGRIANASGDFIGLQIAKISVAGSEGPWPTGTDCGGVDGTADETMVLGTGTNAFYIGVQIRGHTASAPPSGLYSSTNPGGNSFQIDVMYQ